MTDDPQNPDSERLEKGASLRLKRDLALYKQANAPVDPSASLFTERPPAPVQPEPRPAPAQQQFDDSTWNHIQRVALDRHHLDANRIITAARTDPAHVAFDVLRTRLLQLLRDKGWHRVAITSPTKGCGKSFIAANLAISLSRQENCRTVLMDMDLRQPSTAKVLGLKPEFHMGQFLREEIAPADFLQRPENDDLNINHTLAVGLNGHRESYAAEVLQMQSTTNALDRMMQEIRPDVVIHDMPPSLYHDDVLAFRKHYDGVLLVVGGGKTTAREVRDLERRLRSETPLLGVLLNQAEGLSIANYSY